MLKDGLKDWISVTKGGAGFGDAAILFGLPDDFGAILVEVFGKITNHLPLVEYCLFGFIRSRQ
jgi:hypothetical protein